MFVMVIIVVMVTGLGIIENAEMLTLSTLLTHKCTVCFPYFILYGDPFVLFVKCKIECCTITCHFTLFS